MQVEEKWWAEAMNTAVEVTNKVPCAANQSKTPFEVFFGRKPSVAHLKVFGAQNYAHTDKSNRSKFDRKAYKCLFLGYLENMKGYGVWNLEARHLETTHSTKLQELQHSKYVEVVCCDKPMDRMNSMENQHYEEEDMPLERQHNSDDAMKTDEEFREQDEHLGEDDVNMDINTEKEIVPRGRLDGSLVLRHSHHLGPITFSKVSR
uniref:Putative polyprotein n=1 Tax=Albugo laibachii Nc14 TaxID=890382 RepID=F0WAC1_9STRA|nr:putative polyprotein [Albugo laibachii Nc14]|eukprot:CCA18092.1 putative polyprotein [Albugo laibachii Nc14]